MECSLNDSFELYLSVCAVFGWVVFGIGNIEGRRSKIRGATLWKTMHSSIGEQYAARCKKARRGFAPQIVQYYSVKTQELVDILTRPPLGGL
jgi:hypothetical protein